MFDVDGSGALDAEEFKTMMRVLRHRTRQARAAWILPESLLHSPFPFPPCSVH